MIYLAGLLLLFMYPATVAMCMTQWSKKPIKVKRKVKSKTGQMRVQVRNVQPKLKFGEMALCCLPYGSACMLWKSLYGTCKWTVIVSILAVSSIVFRVVVVFATLNETLFLASFFVFWIAILLTHIVYAVSYIAASRLLSLGLTYTIFSALFPYGVAFFMRMKIPKIMYQAAVEEDKGVV